MIAAGSRSGSSERCPKSIRHSRHGAFLDGFSLHAGVRIHGIVTGERLCRYLLRPPLSLQRLSQGEEGRLVYRMKRPRGGSLFLLLAPDELLARLATLVPQPRVHGLRYHGVFAPNSKVRRRAVPAAPDPVSAAPETPATMTEKPLRAKPARIARKYRVPWADLLQKFFAIDVARLSGLQRPEQLIAFVRFGLPIRRARKNRFGSASEIGVFELFLVFDSA
ncbi:MAG TPA: transposase [Anaeromyxobacter sp.]